LEIKHKQHLTKQDFNHITDEIRALVGKKFKNHKDGDSERTLLKEIN